MKRIQIGIMALAAVAGVSSAFTMAPKKSFAPHIFAKIGASGNAFSYTTVAPTNPLNCDSNTGSVCEISTTISVTDLNASNLNSFPVQETTPVGSERYVRYVTAANRLYK